MSPFTCTWLYEPAPAFELPISYGPRYARRHDEAPATHPAPTAARIADDDRALRERAALRLLARFDRAA